MPDLIEHPTPNNSGDQQGASQQKDADDLSKAWREFVRAASDFLRKKAEPARPWIDQAERKLHGMEEKFVTEGRKAYTAADSYVREKPWQALGIAAGAAFVIGSLLKKK